MKEEGAQKMKKEQNKKLIRAMLCTILMFGVMLAGGYNYMYNNGLSGKYVNTEPKDGQLKVACIGDSITYGHGISDWKKNSYPALLQELLGANYHVANFGFSGACVNPEGNEPYVNCDVYKTALEYDADIIVFMMGTNDAKIENWTDVEHFMEDYMSLVDSLTEGDSIPKVYLGLCAEAFYSEDVDPSTGITSYNIQPGVIDEIVEAIELRSLTSGVGMKTIDIHSLTEAHAEWFKVDGIHPNNDGAKAIAEAVAEAIKELE